MNKSSMTSREKAEYIKANITMYELLERYGMHLDRAGKMICPFHGDKETPSFGVYEDGVRWHCFGCHRAGSVIDFVMIYHDINFNQALIRLNNEFSLGLPFGQQTNPIPALQAQKRAREIELHRSMDRELKAERHALQLGYIAEFRLWGNAYLITDDSEILDYAKVRMNELDFAIDLIEGCL